MCGFSVPRRWVAGLVFFLALGAALAVALPALADYLGPNRTVTVSVWRRLQCHYQATYDPPDPGWWGCALDLYEPPDGSCPSDVAGYFTPSACSWPEPFCLTEGCDIDLTERVVSCNPSETGCRQVGETVTHPEATVSGSISCGVAGSSGWCRGGAELSLSGSEPLAGYSILALEGTRNGETFACPGSSCSVLLAEGTNDFTFWALSSYGDSSRMGTASGRLDGGAPVIAGEVTGTAGEAGWYVSEVTVTASAGDAVSGLVSFDLALDGDGWAPYSGPITLADGEHTLALRAIDVAGNVGTESLDVRVDTRPPDLTLSVGRAFCPGCGEVLDLALDIQDMGSGVAEWSLSADGVGIASGNGPASETFAWDGSGLGAGTHTITFSARDVAGNTAETSATVRLVAPTAVPSTQQSSNPGPQGMVVLSAPTATSAPIPTRTALPTRTQSTSSFGGLPAVPLSGEEGLPDEPEAGPETAPAASAQGSSSGMLWGGAAVALIGVATAVALEAARRRREEEARLQEEMARRNAEAEAREKAELAALAAAKADAEARLAAGQILHKATRGQRPSSEWLAGAVVAAEAARRTWEERRAERKEQVLNEAQARRPEAGWEDDYRRYMAESERRRAEAREQVVGAAGQATATPMPSGATATATASATATATPRPLPVPTPTPSTTPVPDQSRRSATSGQSWWEQAIERLIMAPPPWLSLSFQLKRDFGLGNWTMDEYVSYQPSPDGWMETLVWQQARLGVQFSERVTSNPSAPVDFDLANFRITIRGRPDENERRVDFFMQPLSWRFGWTESWPLVDPDVPLQPGQTARRVNVTTVDYDLFGRDWWSWKVSEASGAVISSRHQVGEGEFEITRSALTEGKMQIHRWTRTVAVVVTIAVTAYYLGMIVVPAVEEAARRLLTNPNPGWEIPWQ
ncbi:MAG: hypothetical protein AB1449_09880 [Chloroflexota bacterium]